MTKLPTGARNAAVFVLMLVALSGFDVGSTFGTSEEDENAVEPVGESVAKVEGSTRNGEAPRSGINAVEID